MAKLWQKSYDVDKEIEKFTVGNDFLLDKNLVKYDVYGSIAHASMLNKIGIVNNNEFKKFKKALLEILKLNEIQYFVLDEGWNFRFVTEDMEFRTLNEIKGNCEVTSAYYFDSLLQNWDSIGLNEKLEGLFRGFIIKSENNCRFKFENEIPMPPPLPVDETESSPGGSGGAGSGSAVPCNTLSLNKCSENSKCVNYAGDYCLNVEEIGKIAGNYDCGYLETNDCEKATICKVVNSKCVAQ